jgi:DNA primase
VDVKPETFTLLTVPGRVKRLKKDPWQGFFALRQSITPEMRRQAAKLGQ